MRHGQQHQVERTFGKLCRQIDTIFVASLALIGHRIVDRYGVTQLAECGGKIGHLAVAQVRYVFLESQPQHQRRAALAAARGVQFAGDPFGHRIVDSASGGYHVGLDPQLAGAVREIIGVDTDAVSADEAGGKREEVPLGPGGSQHVPGRYADPRKYLRDLVHESDVDIALCVLDHLGGFGHLDRAGAEHTSGSDRPVKRGNIIQHFRGLPGHNLGDLVDRMLAVARIDPLGTVCEVEVLAASQARDLF